MVVFTDLDGTLLDHDTYSFEPARPALERLAKRKIPLVFCTSKTRSETEVWRERMGNRDPFITENGGAAFVPRGYFPFQIPRAVSRDDYEVMGFGDPYAELAAALAEAELITGTAIRAFHQMDVQEVARRCGLPLEQAALAKQREYDEPFEILEPQGASHLLAEIERRGKRWTRGGRFYHITGNNDKAAAVAALVAVYKRIDPSITTIALGDGLNDAGMLNSADMPVLVRSQQTLELSRRVPHGRVTEKAGPEGWNGAILEMIPE